MNVKADAQANSGNDGFFLIAAFFVPVSSLRRDPQYLLIIERYESNF